MLNAGISAPGYMLSAGRAVSPLPLHAFRGLTCPTRPAGQGRLRQLCLARRKCEFHFRGVSTLPLQSLHVCMQKKDQTISYRGGLILFSVQPVFQCPQKKLAIFCDNIVQRLAFGPVIFVIMT
jgi:hypothetical protein